MKTLVYILTAFLAISVVGCDKEDMDLTSQEQESNTTETRGYVIPEITGEELHAYLQKEWSREDIVIGNGFILGGWGNDYMTITKDTMYLYSMWNGADINTDGRYIYVCQLDTIPYSFKNPNYIVTKEDTFNIYENAEDGNYILRGRKRNFKLLPFHFDYSQYPEDVEYRYEK